MAVFAVAANVALGLPDMGEIQSRLLRKEDGKMKEVYQAPVMEVFEFAENAYCVTMGSVTAE